MGSAGRGRGAWVHAAFGEAESVLGPNTFNEACRQVLKKIPSTGMDFGVLVAVSIGRAEELGRAGMAAPLWGVLGELLQDDLTQNGDEESGPNRPMPEDHEIELSFIVANQEIDVIARLPGTQAFASLQRAAGERHHLNSSASWRN